MLHPVVLVGNHLGFAMKISVVTVVRNNVEHIAETIRSVLDQNYPELEYIVIDGASTDGTVDVVRSFGDRIAQFVSEPDRSLYDAMNKGIARATGDVVGMINSGDRYLPGALELVAKSFAGHSLDDTIFWGDVQYEFLGRVKGFRPHNLKRGAFAPHPSMFVPKRIYDRIGAYDISLRFLGDYDFMYRAINHHGLKPLYVPELVAFYREGGLSDRNIVPCLKDELTVKLRYGQSPLIARTVYMLKLIKNQRRILLANR